MRRPGPQQVLTQIKRLEEFVNDWRMIPATGVVRNRVFLALLSKALTVGRAVCALVEAGFPAEAFGLTRTLIDIFFSVRYMSNKDTDARVRTYVEYMARVAKEWVILNAKYFPNRKLELSASHREMMKIADKFKSRHQWASHGGQAKFMAFEPDTFEINEQGRPITGELDYDAFYFWTSQYVHVTIHALVGHAADPGEVFRVRPKSTEEKDLARLALFNTVTFLTKITIQACRGMREEQPDGVLRGLFKMMPKFGRG
jgi:Family of unknown function (DUF5677)